MSATECAESFTLYTDLAKKIWKSHTRGVKAWDRKIAAHTAEMDGLRSQPWYIAGQYFPPESNYIVYEGAPYNCSDTGGWCCGSHDEKAAAAAQCKKCKKNVDCKYSFPCAGPMYLDPRVDHCGSKLSDKHNRERGRYERERGELYDLIRSANENYPVYDPPDISLMCMDCRQFIKTDLGSAPADHITQQNKSKCISHVTETGAKTDKTADKSTFRTLPTKNRQVDLKMSTVAKTIRFLEQNTAFAILSASVGAIFLVVLFVVARNTLRKK
jgi:hypothetical protein